VLFELLQIVLVAIVGAIVGSFLNVVVYRMPRGLSVSSPRWSFCPHCERPIRVYDNIPILSWFALRGRCRACGEPIPPIYPLVEAVCALLFVMAWDALFVSGVAHGAGPIARDWPIAVAYVTLFACLLASAAMDFEAYIIDIRLSVLALAVAVACHGLRGLPGVGDVAADGGALLPASMAIIGFAMGIVWLSTHVIVRLFVGRGDAASDPLRHGDIDPEPAAQGGADGPSGDELATGNAEGSSSQAWQPIPMLLLVAAIVALVVWQIADPTWGVVEQIPPGGQRGFVGCFLLMTVLILVSQVHREADQQIIDEIEEERDTARRMVGRELVGLLPAIVVGVGLFVYLNAGGRLDAGWAALLPMERGIGHVAGLMHAVAGAVWSAGLGWGVRILGTTGLGKEAFGTGDIYLMAAIGAALGVGSVVFLCFIASILALVGVLALLFQKRSRAVPFGPWLGLGAVVVMWVERPLLVMFRPMGQMMWSVLTGRGF